MNETTLQFSFFFGAFYLFLINTVFIALATFLTVRFLRLPYTLLPDKKAHTTARRIIGTVVLLTIIPSIYFGYDLVQQDRFTKKAERFVSAEAGFKNDYLLNKKIDAKAGTITLVYGGAMIADSQITGLTSRLQHYDLAGAKLTIHQGFSYLAPDSKTTASGENIEGLQGVLKAKEEQLQFLQRRADSIQNNKALHIQVYKELSALYTDLLDVSIADGNTIAKDSIRSVLLVTLRFAKPKSPAEKTRLNDWLKTRFRREDVTTSVL